MIRFFLVLLFFTASYTSSFSQCNKQVVTNYDKFNKSTSYNVSYNIDKDFEFVGSYISGSRLTMRIHASGSSYYALGFVIKERYLKSIPWEDLDIIDFKSNPNSYVQFLFTDGTTYKIRNNENTMSFAFNGTLWLKGSAKETEDQNKLLNKLKTIKIEAIRLSVGQNYDFDLTPQHQKDFMEIFNCLPH